MIIILLFMTCNQPDGKKFLGYYTMEQNSSDTTFVIIHNSDSDTYVSKLFHMRLKDYVFKYNADTKTLISSTNDTMSLNEKGTELRFTNENGPRIFYKMK